MPTETSVRFGTATLSRRHGFIDRVGAAACRIILGLVVMTCFTRSASADELAPPSGQSNAQVAFADDVYPILQRSCFECHGEQRQEGGLRLDRHDDVFESGTIEPGDANNSELLRRLLLPRNHDEVMPAVGERLSPKQIAVIRRWIDAGAEWSDQVGSQEHWSYVPPSRPALPQVAANRWVQSPIDRFVLRRLNQEGLSPSDRARPEKLVRRVYLDLIGLPPSPEEVAAFLQDPSDERFAALVDDLLQRPQFGERWARPWLDLARYADSHGFQRDNLREHWAYRDWVIRALNQDMPFDQFTIEQLAGDLLPDATESQRIATGFHRCTPINVEAGSLPEETRSEQVIDRVNTTGAVWLGTTLECCQCHDHKYDPFSAKEYYQLLAFFNSTELEADRTNPKQPSSIQFKGSNLTLRNPKKDDQREALKDQIAEQKRELTRRRKTLDRTLEDWVEQSRTLVDRPRNHALKVVAFESRGATDAFEILDDGSVLLVGGDPPDTDVYTVTLSGDVANVRALRLDVLRDDSLPGGGPGRGDPVRRNFVLNEFVAERVPGTDKTESASELNAVPLKFSGALASFSQKNWDVAGALQPGKNSGWAISPKFDQSHWAVFVLSDSLTLDSDSKLRLTLRQRWGRSRTIGRFKVSAVTGNPSAESIPSEIVDAIGNPPSRWTGKQRNALLDFRSQEDPGCKRIEAKIAKLQGQVDAITAETTLVMSELPKPRMTAVFERGDYRKPGEPVQPGVPAVLHPLDTDAVPNRLTLAKWLVARDNPLVARVTVNRWWAELFGGGLVTTMEDFGIKGDSPTHPELLDWLAVELMDNGWSMKHILKTIVLSSTYQQSSTISPELLERDDQNRLLARGPRFRMDAEMIRDNALAISGLLDRKQFGPSIYPFQPDGVWKKVGGTAYQYDVSPGGDSYRRGLYVILKRGSPYPSLVNFDATARLACTVERSRTNTPLQALTLLNDPVYVEAAGALVRRVQREKPNESVEDQISHAFQICTGRRPATPEIDALIRLHREQLDADGGDETQAWQSVATVLLNLHETITKD